jgi:anti-sigma-K factor RskA
MTGQQAHDDLDRLAAEHVIGLLEPHEQERAERLAATDESFAARVGAWQARLMEFDETAPRMDPGAALWMKVEASLRREAPAPATAPSAPRPGLWRSLGFWRGAGLAGAFASLLLAVGLGFTMREAQRKPALVAVMLDENGQPAGLVNVRADGRAELVALRDIKAPDGRVLQIWTLWDRARGPVSLGTLASARNIPLSLDALPRTAPDQLFEITVEPAGGSPTGRPTGPVLMKGTASTAL